MDATHPPPRRLYDIRASGIIYVAITVLIALGAFNSQNNLLFWAFSFALAILLVSGLLSGNMLMGIAVERTLPPHAVANRPFTIRYRVTNRSRFSPVFALEVSERSPTRTRPLATPVIAAVAHVPPRSHADAEALCRPAARGLLRLGSIRIWSAFPFGIIGKVLRFDRPASILVRPEPIAPDPALLAHLDAIGQAGQAPRGPGPGVEFFSLREYVPGDRPRSIAWRASARRDELLVRQTSPPTPRRIIISLELRADLAAAQAETAIRRAAGLIDEAASRGFEVGLRVPSAKIHRPARPGSGHAGRLLDDLGLLELAHPVPITERTLRSERPSAHTRATIVVIDTSGSGNAGGAAR